MSYGELKKSLNSNLDIPISTLITMQEMHNSVNSVGSNTTNELKNIIKHDRFLNNGYATSSVMSAINDQETFDSISINKLFYNLYPSLKGTSYTDLYTNTTYIRFLSCYTLPDFNRRQYMLKYLFDNGYLESYIASLSPTSFTVNKTLHDSPYEYTSSFKCMKGTIRILTDIKLKLGYTISGISGSGVTKEIIFDPVITIDGNTYHNTASMSFTTTGTFYATIAVPINRIYFYGDSPLYISNIANNQTLSVSSGVKVSWAKLTEITIVNFGYSILPATRV